jgi:nicotinamidase-related amidase
MRVERPTSLTNGIGLNREDHSHLVELLVPEKDDYFVLKPKHSGFDCTTLDILLQYLGVKVVVLAGFAGNICVLFTAIDA